MDWYLGVLKKYAVFKGRAQRKEYWWFFGINLAIMLGLFVIDPMLGISGNPQNPMLPNFYALAVMLPTLAVGARRLHDTGRAAWWLLLYLIPVLGGLVLLFFFALDSEPGDNQYGPNPKGL